MFFQRHLLSLLITSSHHPVKPSDPIFCLSQMVTWIFLLYNVCLVSVIKPYSFLFTKPGRGLASVHGHLFSEKRPGFALRRFWQFTLISFCITM